MTMKNHEKQKPILLWSNDHIKEAWATKQNRNRSVSISKKGFLKASCKSNPYQIATIRRINVRIGQQIAAARKSNPVS